MTTERRKAIAEYRAGGMTREQAEQQYQFFLEAKGPKPNRVVVPLAAAAFTRLRKEADRRGHSLAEVVRGKIRIAEGAEADLRTRAKAEGKKRR